MDDYAPGDSVAKARVEAREGDGEDDGGGRLHDEYCGM